MIGIRKPIVAAAATIGLCVGAFMLADPAPAAPAQPPGPEATAHRNKALETAGTRYHDAAVHQCGGRPGIPAENRQIVLKPARVFNNLYYVGLGWVGAWAVNTSDGIVLLDTLNAPSDVENTIIPGLRAFGLDPANVKYIVLTHNHADHTSGAQYFVEHYKTRVIAAGPEWDLMEKGPTRTNPPPKRDMTLVDGQTLKVGDTTFSFILTPGHTPASTSIIFPSTDDAGKKHTVALVGGITAQPNMASQKIAYDGLEHILAFSKVNHVDVEIVDHPHVDDSLQLLKAAAERNKGDPNGFIVGEAGFQSFVGMLRECYLSNMANLENR